MRLVDAARCWNTTAAANVPPDGSRLVAGLDVTARSRAGRLRTDLPGVGALMMMRKQLPHLRGLAERSAVAA